MYIVNDGDLYRRQYQSILKNLATKKAQGKYDSALAVKLLMYLVDEGAKKYAKEFERKPQNWNTIFDKPTRMDVARELVKKFESEWEEGSFRDLMPKKYQKSSGGK